MAWDKKGLILIYFSSQFMHLLSEKKVIFKNILSTQSVRINNCKMMILLLGSVIRDDLIAIL